MPATVDVNDYLLTATGRLSLLLAWTWIAVLHAAGLALVLAALWCFEVRPQEVRTVVLSYADDRLVGFLAASGVTALGVLAGYAWALRAAAAAIDVRIRRYLVRGL